MPRALLLNTDLPPTEACLTLAAVGPPLEGTVGGIVRDIYRILMFVYENVVKCDGEGTFTGTFLDCGTGRRGGRVGGFQAVERGTEGGEGTMELKI